MAIDGFPVFDGHNDTLLSLSLPERGEGRSFFERSDDGHIDLPPAREGRFGGGMFAVCVPRPHVSRPIAVELDAVAVRVP